MSPWVEGLYLLRSYDLLRDEQFSESLCNTDVVNLYNNLEGIAGTKYDLEVVDAVDEIINKMTGVKDGQGDIRRD